MDKNQLFAITGAVLIATGGVAGVRAWANAAGAATLRAPSAEVDNIHTLAPIEVRPTREQLRELHPQARAEQDSDVAGGGGVALDMPYYSFAVMPMRASRG
jgi:hypothetical protein